MRSPMLATAILVFREFLEAFLIAGVFLSISKKLKLRREFEILLALGVGVLLSVFLAAGVFFLGDNARAFVTEENAELLEGFLMVFAGLFIAYVVFELHRFMNKANREALGKTKSVVEERGFDIAIFFSVIFLVLREGFEIALFTASVSLFADFAENLLGLFIGFSVAAIVGTATYFAYSALPIAKVFSVTEYAIIALGAVFTANGLGKLFEFYFNDYAELFAIHPPFMSTEVSTLSPLLMAAYLVIVYFAFFRKKSSVAG